VNEQALLFECNRERLIAILHAGAASATRGIVIVVGGPQYRVGSHRQFVQLARDLAAAGTPVLRFDYRGMGDADGTHPGFEHIAPDITAAIALLQTRAPGVREIVLWGLCDAASAALMYAPGDARVTGLVLANPWVRTQTSEAQAYLRHYYGARVLSRISGASSRAAESTAGFATLSLRVSSLGALARGWKPGGEHAVPGTDARGPGTLPRSCAARALGQRSHGRRVSRCGARIAALAQGARLGARRAP
jgi:pimeloyl-ACP methyl ester carboxylesterase